MVYGNAHSRINTLYHFSFFIFFCLKIKLTCLQSLPNLGRGVDDSILWLSFAQQILAATQHSHKCRVARWYVLSIKKPNMGIFWGALEWKMLVFLVPFGTFFSHFVHFVAIWYILW
jgi:hypothetical protein